MADDTVSSQPADSGASLKKKGGKKNMMIIAAVVVIVVALVAVVVLGGFLNSNEPATLEKVLKRGKLVVGTNVPWPPFEDYNITTKQYEGIDIEIVQYIADYLGVELVIKAMDFDTLIGAVQTGQIDIAISSITIRPDRAESVDFSIPYYIANQAVLVHDDSSIANIDDLNGTKISAQLGTTGSFWVQEELVDKGRILASDFAVYDTIINAVQVVQTKEKHAAILDTPVANKYAASTSYNLKVAFEIETNEQYGIACPKNSPELLAEINAALQQMIDTGTLTDVINKWV